MASSDSAVEVALAEHEQLEDDMSELKLAIAQLNDVLNSISVLSWDSSVMMPHGACAAQARGQQVATLTGVARSMLLSPQTAAALEKAKTGLRADDHDDRDTVSRVTAALDFHNRIPAKLSMDRAMIKAAATQAWTVAREQSDFSIFAPHLEKTVEISRVYADAIGVPPGGHPYDALLGLSEPGTTLASLRDLFAELKAGITPILRHAASNPPRTDFLHREYPVTTQEHVAQKLAQAIGYNFDGGRLDPTVHPFAVSFTSADVRITTRYYPKFINASIFGTLHESGHAMYEQGVAPELNRTVFTTDLIGMSAIGGTSSGVHESQSRLWENHVGRSAAFWRLHFPTLQAAFPEALTSDITWQDFHAAINAAEPGLIRVEADELTYDFHIMLRTELEAQLLTGELEVSDVPAAWNAAVKKMLGVDVPDDARGCLQDIHWSGGYLGSFCSYTIGNVVAAQLFDAAVKRDSSIAPALEKGDYRPLKAWLTENVWRHGRRYGRDELLVRATGRPMEAGPYIAYLQKKHGGGAKI